MSRSHAKLTPAVFAALEAAIEDGAANARIHGRAAHGGYAATRTLLLRHGYINPFNEKITDAGRAAFEAWKERQK